MRHAFGKPSVHENKAAFEKHLRIVTRKVKRLCNHGIQPFGRDLDLSRFGLERYKLFVKLALCNRNVGVPYPLERGGYKCRDLLLGEKVCAVFYQHNIAKAFALDPQVHKRAEVIPVRKLFGESFRLWLYKQGLYRKRRGVTDFLLASKADHNSLCTVKSTEYGVLGWESALDLVECRLLKKTKEIGERKISATRCPTCKLGKPFFKKLYVAIH